MLRCWVCGSVCCPLAAFPLCWTALALNTGLFYRLLRSGFSLQAGFCRSLRLLKDITVVPGKCNRICNSCLCPRLLMRVWNAAALCVPRAPARLWGPGCRQGWPWGAGGGITASRPLLQGQLPVLQDCGAACVQVQKGKCLHWLTRVHLLTESWLSACASN